MTVISGVDAGARLDALPAGRFHHRIVILVSTGLFLDGFGVYLGGGVLGSLVKNGWSSLDLTPCSSRQHSRHADRCARGRGRLASTPCSAASTKRSTR